MTPPYYNQVISPLMVGNPFAISFEEYLSAKCGIAYANGLPYFIIIMVITIILIK
jgi:hypothetical protein